MSDRAIRERFRFFHEHAGYIVGERAICAMRLARAEERFESNGNGLRVRWEYDEAALWDHEEWCGRKDCSHLVEVCFIEERCDKCGSWDMAESLSGIIDADDNYRRVVAAELLAERYA